MKTTYQMDVIMKAKYSTRFLWRAIIALTALSVLPAAILAQDTATREPSVAIREDFSDDELKSFVKANEKVSAIQMQAEQKMIRAIEDEGLSVERFHEILEQQRDPSRTSETSMDELESFNNAAQVILEENERIEKQMTTSIEEEGIDVETYKQIMLAYQQSPAVQDRVNGLISGDK